MDNKLLTISGVRGFIDSNGTAKLNLEDCARGLGFSRVAASGNEVIRWETVAKYLETFGACQLAGTSIGKTIQEQLPEFIPENIFYRLAMKAKNETAEKFQALVADEILPSIRKHGMYATDQLLDNPDFLIKALTELKKEREEKKALQLKTSQQSQLIDELKPKADYTDTILKNKGLVTITQIAKDYGMSGQAMNKTLHDLKVQYKLSDQWLLYANLQGKGYTHSETFSTTDVYGRPSISMSTKWTQKGRLYLYNLLKENNIIPMIEKDVA
jgi:anti-repressor protein